MPLSALREIEVDHIVGIKEMAPLLCRLVEEGVTQPPVGHSVDEGLNLDSN
jgi:hypothetical protein